MTGVIEGGWEFVWAAYGVTALVLVVYGVSVGSRLRSESRRWRAREASSPQLSGKSPSPPAHQEASP